MTEYVLRQLEDGVQVERDGEPIMVPGGVEKVEVRRGYGLATRIKIITGFGDTITQELQPLCDTLRYEGWGRHG